MARLGRYGFLAIAVIFHLIYIYSIFDIYFVSPIVSGMRHHAVPQEPAPAKRLVLFVGMTLFSVRSSGRQYTETAQEMVYAPTKRSNRFRTRLLPPHKPPIKILMYPAR